MAACFRYVLLLLLLGPAPAQAQSDTTTALDTVLTLPDVTVKASRARRAPAAAAQRLTVLDTAALAATGARTVADLLEARTGFFMKRYGAGGLATASLRGTGSTQTLILLDGQRVADPQSGQIDLSLLPTVLLESVNVRHGASSARYGSGGIGGVVRLHTLRPSEDLRVKTTGTAGAYGERRAGGVVSGQRGRFSGVAAAEVSHADGDFSYVNETLAPPQRVRREGAGRSMNTLFGRIGYRTGRQRLSVTAWHSTVERGLPGMAHAPANDARQWDKQLRLLARHEMQTGWGTMQLSGRMQHTQLRYVHPAADAHDTIRTRAYSLNAQLSSLPTARWLVRGGLDAGLDRAGLRGGVRRTRLGAFASGLGDYGRLLVHPALRVDTYASSGRNIAAVSPALGVNVQPLAWNGLRLKVHAGRAFRAPTFSERFYEPGGNPELKAEKGWSAEAGVLLQEQRPAGRLTAEATGFTTRIRDQIVWHPSYAGPGLQVWRPSNVARVVTSGVEASLRGRVQLASAAQLSGGLYFTHTDAEHRANPNARSYGQQLRYVPRQQLKGYLGARWHQLRLDLSARLVGRRFITSDETQALSPYQVFDAQLRYEHNLGPARATFGIALENAFDRRYNIVRFYPMPPRHLRIRLTLETGSSWTADG